MVAVFSKGFRKPDLKRKPGSRGRFCEDVVGTWKLEGVGTVMRFEFY